MKRRSFIKSSFIAGSVSGIMPVLTHAEQTDMSKKQNREFYELRIYNLKNETQQRIVENYYESAAIPALNRLGSSNIGVFTELKPEGQTRIFVLTPYRSFDDFLTKQDQLLNDKFYLKSAEAYLNAPPAEPAYDRIESSFLQAFRHMPAIVPPAKKSRIFELRRYESPNEPAGKKKIEMFNDAGEIEIFKRTGLNPVFFGETLIGSNRPNLTYMLTHEDMAAHDRNWKQFGSDPEWKRISSIPEYADAKIISHISATFLSPASFSQI
ncbi:MAG TPA: NIPSNAP family protein [Flavisolibacter sp.]|jgi:hypothetical protein|nr:NIPSNAP family protein [Flavisolibacter sp.]